MEKLRDRDKQRLMFANKEVLKEYATKTGRSVAEVGQMFRDNECILESLPEWSQVMEPGRDVTIDNTNHSEAEKPEPITGEVEPGAVDLSGGVLPVDTWQRVKDSVDDFLKYECQEVDKKSMTQCTEDTWSACCTYIGIRVFKDRELLRDHHKEKTMGGKHFSLAAVEAGQEMYNTALQIYNKMYSVSDCAHFLGVAREFFYDNRDFALSPARSQFYNKSRKDSEENLRRGVVGGRKGTPFGYTVLLNHDHNYSTSKVEHVSNEKQETAAALPVFGVDQGGALPGEGVNAEN